MKNQFGIIILISFTFLLSSCEDDPQTVRPETTVYTDGVLIVNEGPFSNGTGTVTYTRRDGSALQQKIYQAANSELPIGSIAQSLAVVGDKAYILVNNANTIEVVNRHTFQLLSTIQNIELPRFMIQVSETKSYVTCWDGNIKVLNTVKDEIDIEIPGRTGQEKMLKVDNAIWVLNQGGYGVDSTISVINITTNQIDQTLDIYPRPTGICEDKNGLIWVMCSGRAAYHSGGSSEGHLLAINKLNYVIEKDFVFPDNVNQPTSLIVNTEGSELYYLYTGGVNRFQIALDSLVHQPFIGYEGSFYSIGYDPKENQIYASDVLDYVQKGQVFVYDANSGTEIRSFKAGIVPTYFYFSE